MALLLPIFLSYEDINTDASLDPALHNGSETSEVFDGLVFSVPCADDNSLCTHGGQADF